MTNIETNNKNLKNENEDLKVCLNELELKLKYHNQKDLAYEDKTMKLKEIQEDYADSIKEYKLKQEELRKYYEEKEKDLENEYNKKVKEYISTIDDVNYQNKKILRESEDVIYLILFFRFITSLIIFSV